MSVGGREGAVNGTEPLIEWYEPILTCIQNYESVLLNNSCMSSAKLMTITKTDPMPPIRNMETRTRSMILSSRPMSKVYCGSYILHRIPPEKSGSLS